MPHPYTLAGRNTCYFTAAKARSRLRVKDNAVLGRNRSCLIKFHGNMARVVVRYINLIAKCLSPVDSGGPSVGIKTTGNLIPIFRRETKAFG